VVRAVIFASPQARRLAEGFGLNDIEILGTGRGGRVTVADVRSAMPPVPDGLGEHGAGFFVRVLAKWSLRPDELELLAAAARTIDELRRLEEALAEASPVVPGSRNQVRAHPLVREVREHRLALKQLLGAAGIGIAEATAGSDDLGLARSHAGRQLAAQRWKRGG
jgi:pyruvate/2-oxoglutarate dehydrogenase complex dihydrolipoamide acyltransferase (E2) component